MIPPLDFTTASYCICPFLTFSPFLHKEQSAVFKNIIQIKPVLPIKLLNRFWNHFTTACRTLHDLALPVSLALSLCFSSFLVVVICFSVPGNSKAFVLEALPPEMHLQKFICLASCHSGFNSKVLTERPCQTTHPEVVSSFHHLILYAFSSDHLS